MPNVSQERTARVLAALRNALKLESQHELATRLNVYDADIYNVVNLNRKASTRLWLAMVKAEMVNGDGVEYPYIKVRRDSPLRVALTLRDNLGYEYARSVAYAIVNNPPQER